MSDVWEHISKEKYDEVFGLFEKNDGYSTVRHSVNTSRGSADVATIARLSGKNEHQINTLFESNRMETLFRPAY